MRAFVACCAAAGLLASTAPAAPAAAPDLPAATPVATSSSATARTAVAGSKFRTGLARLLAGAGRASGAWVGSADGTTLFGRRAGRSRKLASNTKLFTTATAISKFGADGHLETAAWRIGPLANGILNGSLLLRGDGDPGLDARDLEALAAKVAAAGVLQVTQPLIFDESAWDANATVPRTGVTGSIGGSLSALMYPDGSRTAANRFVEALRARGISIPNGTRQGELDAQLLTDKAELASVGSVPIADLIRDTNIPSNNFLAEVLVKAVGSHFGGFGSTAAGVNVMQGFAGDRGAPLSAENGSGLTVRNRASPRAVGKLLVSMLREPADVTAAFTNSLAVAGQSGTLARRMRGTAAAGRCKAKTGTISGVSALSGYCFRAGRPVVFSLLMNKASVSRAQLVQDRMAALVARYSG